MPASIENLYNSERSLNSIHKYCSYSFTIPARLNWICIVWKKCYWSSLARKFNVDSLYIRKLIKLPHNRWCLFLLTSTWKLWTLSISAWKLCTNNIYRGDNFHGTMQKQNIDVSLFKLWKRQVIESLLSANIAKGLRNGVHADQQRNLCNTFLLIAPCYIACPKK